MAIYVAIAASLIGISVVIRIVRFVLGLMLVAMVVAVVSSHGPTSIGQLVHLL